MTQQHKELPNLLVIDNDGLDLWVPQMLLQPYGLKVFQCNYEWEVISELLQGRVDLILINPYARGIDFFRLKGWIEHLEISEPPIWVSYAEPHQVYNLQRIGLPKGVTKPLRTALPLLRLLATHFPHLKEQMPHVFLKRGRGKRRQQAP